MIKYKHTIDMAAGFRAAACKIFERFIGKQINHLEIGVYEGLSGCFMLDEVLTHPKSTYVGIDPYEPPHDHAYPTALLNLKREHRNVTLFQDYSFNVLPDLFAADFLFETVYIDGCHSYGGCKLDIEQCWPLLKPGGIILCDDYEREDYGVKQAVKEFLESLDPVSYKVSYEDYLIAWTKL